MLKIASFLNSRLLWGGEKLVVTKFIHNNIIFTALPPLKKVTKFGLAWLLTSWTLFSLYTDYIFLGFSKLFCSNWNKYPATNRPYIFNSFTLTIFLQSLEKPGQKVTYNKLTTLDHLKLVWGSEYITYRCLGLLNYLIILAIKRFLCKTNEPLQLDS